jgi:hypothetical protein
MVRLIRTLSIDLVGADIATQRIRTAEHASALLGDIVMAVFASPAS